MNRRQSGSRGEALALAALEKQGMKLLAMNHRAGRLELDLILAEGNRVVFVEVKARGTDRFGLGREAVTLKKQRHILDAARLYLAQNGLEERPVRFDVAEVDLLTGAVTHIPNAFTE